MRVIADCIARVLDQPDDAAVAAAVEQDVLELCSGFPLFSWEPVKRAGKTG
jgi:glycine/serine hydroxymethyltransferase